MLSAAVSYHFISDLVKSKASVPGSAPRKEVVKCLYLGFGESLGQILIGEVHTNLANIHL
jgi:hypothetical protein